MKKKKIRRGELLLEENWTTFANMAIKCTTEAFQRLASLPAIKTTVI